MAPRALSTATISFGLVSIPVKLFSSTNSSAGISFNLLHKACGGRLKQQYICPKEEDTVVPRSDMVKGYEFAKDQYVLFTEQELKDIEERPNQSIDITEFVPHDRVPAVYIEKSYYLGPDKGGDRAYKLLAEAMRQTGRSALAKYAARGKMYLVMVTPLAEGLALFQLRYADEVRTFEEVPVGDAQVKDGELKLAIQLVEQIASDTFSPEKYEDEVKKRTEELIQRKVEGEEVTFAEPEAPRAQIIDLMEALKASIGGEEAAPKKKGKKDAEEDDDARKGPKRAAAPKKKAAKGGD